MPQPAPHPVKRTLDEKIAKFREPVKLSQSTLPRFVLILLEIALHRYLCSVAACLEELLKRYRAGTLAPWPEQDEDAAMAEPRSPKYRMTSRLAASRGRAGAKPVRTAPDSAPKPGEEASAAAGIADMAGARRPAARSRQWQAGAGRAAMRADVASVLRPLDRCRPGWLCRAAEMRRQNCAQIIPII